MLPILIPSVKLSNVKLSFIAEPIRHEPPIFAQSHLLPNKESCKQEQQKQDVRRSRRRPTYGKAVRTVRRKVIIITATASRECKRCFTAEQCEPASRTNHFVNRAIILRPTLKLTRGASGFKAIGAVSGSFVVQAHHHHHPHPQEEEMFNLFAGKDKPAASGGPLQGYKVTDVERSRKYGVAADSLRMLRAKASEKFKVNNLATLSPGWWH